MGVAVDFRLLIRYPHAHFTIQDARWAKVSQNWLEVVNSENGFLKTFLS